MGVYRLEREKVKQMNKIDSDQFKFSKEKSILLYQSEIISLKTILQGKLISKWSKC